MTEIHMLSPEYAAIVRRARAMRAAYFRAAAQRLFARLTTWGRPQSAGPLAGANA